MKARILFIAASVAVLAGCPDDDDDYYRYDVSVTNLTPNQPMSPLAVLTHNTSFELFEIGQSASVDLEYLAEGGSNAELIALSDSDANVYQGISGNGLILSGEQDTVSIRVDLNQEGFISVASMLVNTNDAFVGESGLSLKSLAVGDTFTMNMNVWDSGTELNDELAETIPGPAGGGEGFNSDRNDTDVVSFHSGVISQDDGLATSALSGNHRFLNPGARITITRTE
ncbi:spondin domain-containing protein [Vibrio sp. TMPB1044]|uniref:spondin domain-containing protein n=1 Tax=Vibrio sp. TMPB1044 TaxID=3051822 RepID=UPI00255B62A7|nr:spondin domain-containing protein [Vibrio sp. TMPB1044]MDL5027250.1 spondin domain-containing protein [Vibrio sp. TMPB1044]MDN5207378.1 spondin domain-containing protein [Vibrio sp. TMPB1044]